MPANDPRYALGPMRRLKLHARWDLRKVNKYLELHALFGDNTWLPGQGTTTTARLVHIGGHWAALYVQAGVNVTADKIAAGIENVLAYQAAHPNREPTTTRRDDTQRVIAAIANPDTHLYARRHAGIH